ncbi:unnamed protein product, partial [Clonostachys byssicola]
MLHRLEVAHDAFYEQVFHDNDNRSVAGLESLLCAPDAPLEFSQQDKCMYWMMYEWFQWWNTCFGFLETQATAEDMGSPAEGR